MHRLTSSFPVIHGPTSSFFTIVSHLLLISQFHFQYFGFPVRHKTGFVTKTFQHPSFWFQRQSAYIASTVSQYSSILFKCLHSHLHFTYSLFHLSQFNFTYLLPRLIRTYAKSPTIGLFDQTIIIVSR